MDADTPATEPAAEFDAVSAFENALGKGFAPDPEPQAAEAPKAEEEPAGEPKEEPQEESKPITVMVDGKEVALTAEQVAEAYKSGLRQSDYTKKTTEAAEVRKAADAEKQKAQAERQQLHQTLQRTQMQLEAVIQGQQQINWEELLQNDLQGYLQQRHLLERRQAALAETMRNRQQLESQLQAEQLQARQAFIAEQHQALLDKLPEWKDEAKAKADKSAIREYLVGQGYQSEQVDALADATMVVMVRKAMQWDQLQDKAKETLKAVEKLPPRVEKPGVARPTDGRTASMQQLKKTGRAEDAAAIFEKLL